MKPTGEKKGASLRSILPLTRALLLDAHTRRQTMFYTIVSAAAMVVIGGTVGFDWLRERPLLFLGFWLLCLWLTVLAVLLSVYDMLILRLEARRVRRELRKRIEEEIKETGE